MNKHVLFAAVAATLFAAPVHAIKINDQAVTANGGNTADIQGTAPNVFDTLRTASMASQFDAVGRIGDCTGTWLGAEGEYAWVLTAARCVTNTNLAQAADHLTFTDRNGVALAGGTGSTSYIHPKRLNRPSGVREAGTNIALVRLKRLPVSDTDAPAAPVIYDGKTEAGTPVSFVAYGSVFANNANVNAVWPTVGERRAWGESNLDGVNENGHALFANYQTGSALRWAGLTTSDAGSAWWQEREGQWQIVATTSGGSTLQSHGTRVSTYAAWIKDLFPSVKLSSDKRIDEDAGAEITESRSFESPHQANKYVGYIKSPGQPNVDAPTSLYAQNYENGTTMVKVPVTNAATGEERMAVIRARRDTAICGAISPMNNFSSCPAGNKLKARFELEDQLLSAGRWRGQLSIDGKNGVNGELVSQFLLDIDVAVPMKPISASQGLDTGSYFGTSIAFTIPTQASATGPTSMNSTNATTGVSMITVNAREAVTQVVVPIKLRAQRNNGCAELAMNNALGCSGFANSKLKVWFDPSDHVSLQPGRYRAQFNIQARGWLDRTISNTYPIDVDINLMP